MDGRYGVGAGRYERVGGGAACGSDGLPPVPNLRGLWSALGSFAIGVEYRESRYPPDFVAYLESWKPPLLANVLPE
jgi:hypothetical protein